MVCALVAIASQAQAFVVVSPSLRLHSGGSSDVGSLSGASSCLSSYRRRADRAMWMAKGFG